MQQQPAPTTRRSLFRGGAAIAAIGAVAAAPLIPRSAATSSPTVRAITQPEELIADPVLALVRRYREAEAAQVPIEERATALRLRWLARPGGEPIPWELNRLIAESDRLTEIMADLILEMMETPATTLVGVIAKLRVGLDLYPAELDYSDEATFAFAEDAVQLLEGLVA